MTRKKKTFELVGIGLPPRGAFAGVPVTYMHGGVLMTVWVFGLHPTNVVNSDTDDCEEIKNRELAEDAIEAVKSLWQWFNQQRDEAVASYGKFAPIFPMINSCVARGTATQLPDAAPRQQLALLDF
jgi:hypothetical protein